MIENRNRNDNNECHNHEFHNHDCYNKKCSCTVYPCIAALIFSILSSLFILFYILIIGPPTPPSELRGIQTQLVEAGNTLIDDEDTVVFDTTTNNTSPNIVYNDTTGEFTISQAGNYYISWWILTDGTTSSTQIDFTIEVNGVPTNIGSTPIVTGQLTGAAIITVSSNPSVITLVNSSGNTINFANNSVQANLVILELGI